MLDYDDDDFGLCEKMEMKEGKMTQRMHNHMRNTLRDIKRIIGRSDISDDEKLKGVELNIHLLESVERGEVITSK